MERQSANPEVAGIAKFKEQYDSLSETLRQQCSWSEVETRLLANGGYYLARAQTLNEGGILFGVDEEGNPLFADDGEEPILTDMIYADTRNRVLYEYENGNIKNKGGKSVETGYEMFPDSGNTDKSPEIKMFEIATGKPFIQSPQGFEGDKWRGSWIESGESQSSDPIRCVYFYPSTGDARVGKVVPHARSPRLGVRRMLRIRKL